MPVIPTNKRNTALNILQPFHISVPDFRKGDESAAKPSGSDEEVMAKRQIQAKIPKMSNKA